MAILEINELEKNFKSLNVINHLNMSINEGSIFGFLGQNGAGKTTTIRMILGLSKPSFGQIKLCGEEVLFGSNTTNKYVGYLPDVPEFYGWMKPYEYLTLCGRMYGMDNNILKARALDLLHMVGLESSKRKISGFSRGMKQRLGIAQALIHSPKLLILDEPTSALDPIGRKEILDIILSLKGNLTVMFSTHILSDVERICDTIGILSGGKLALEGKLTDIQHKFGGKKFKLEVEGSDKTSVLIKKLLSLPSILDLKSESDSSYIVSSRNTAELRSSICPILADLGIPLKHFEALESNLEDIFMEVTHSKFSQDNA